MKAQMVASPRVVVLALLFILLAVMGFLALTRYARQAAAQGATTTVEVGSATLDPAASTQVSVTVKNIPSAGLAGYNLTVAFNPAVVNIVAGPGGTPPAVDGGQFPFNAAPQFNVNNTTGSVGFNAVVASGPTSGDLVIAKLNVKAVGSAGAQTALTLTINELINNNLGEITPRSAVNGSVTIAGAAQATPTPTPTPAPTATPTPTPAPPAAPTGLQCTPGNGQATLSWNAVQAATSYVLYMAEVSFTAWSQSLQGAMRHPDITQTSFLHTGLPNGVTQFFRVAAVGAGGEGAMSAQVQCTPAAAQAPTPTPTPTPAPPVAAPALGGWGFLAIAVLMGVLMVMVLRRSTQVGRRA